MRHLNRLHGRAENLAGAADMAVSIEKQVRKQVAEHLRTIQSLLAVSRVPLDVWFAVAKRSSVADLAALAQVSTRFRQVSLNPSIWTTIDFICSLHCTSCLCKRCCYAPRGSHNLPAVKLALLRIGAGTPFHLFVTLHPDGQMADSVVDFAVLERFCIALEERVHHLRTLRLHGTRQCLSAVLRHILRHRDLPGLVDLSVVSDCGADIQGETLLEDYRTSETDDPSTVGHVLRFADMPVLERLTLPLFCQPLLPNMHFSSLTELIFYPPSTSVLLALLPSLHRLLILGILTEDYILDVPLCDAIHALGRTSLRAVYMNDDQDTVRTSVALARLAIQPSDPVSVPDAPPLQLLHLPRGEWGSNAALELTGVFSNLTELFVCPSTTSALLHCLRMLKRLLVLGVLFQNCEVNNSIEDILQTFGETRLRTFYANCRVGRERLESVRSITAALRLPSVVANLGVVDHKALSAFDMGTQTHLEISNTAWSVCVLDAGGRRTLQGTLSHAASITLPALAALSSGTVLEIDTAAARHLRNRTTAWPHVHILILHVKSSKAEEQDSASRIDIPFLRTVYVVGRGGPLPADARTAMTTLWARDQRPVDITPHNWTYPSGTGDVSELQLSEDIPCSCSKDSASFMAYKHWWYP